VPEILMIVAGLSLFSFIGGYISRMTGGGGIDLPLGLEQWVYTIPMVLLGGYVAFPELSSLSYYYSVPIVGAFWFISMLGKRLGHGQYMDLGHFTGKVSTPEKIEFIVKRFFGKDPSLNGNPKGGSFWRDFFGLSIVGLGPVLPLVILLLSYGLTLEGSLVALGGLLKAVAYIIGWEKPFFKKQRWLGLYESTAEGEFLTGILSYLSIGIAFFSILIDKVEIYW